MQSAGDPGAGGWRRSRWRLAQIFITAAWDSATDLVRLGERRAAIATERASLGSFLLVVAGGERRTRAASLGWTSKTSLTRGHELFGEQVAEASAPSIAQVRSGHRAWPIPSSRSTWVAESAPGAHRAMFSVASIATAVWEALCGSMPIVTLPSVSFFSSEGKDHGGHV